MIFPPKLHAPKLRVAISLFVALLSGGMQSLSAQTGLPLNFQPLANPPSVPGFCYLDTDPNIPLGDKTPLLLVHGISLFGGTAADSADGWNNFSTFFYNTPALSSRYKLYRFAYQSNQVSVALLGNYLGALLNNLCQNDQQFSRSQIVVIAHSMGGLVSRLPPQKSRF
jgi:triacylglycerol esterase/lipase EstA (alpha/beta hydrolase family)